VARIALIAAVLVALPSAAGEDAPRRSYVIPAIESLTLQTGFLTFNNLISSKPFAQVNWQSWSSHFNGEVHWNFDTDNMLVNQIGHPYMGNLIFNAARSSGLNFWWGFLYAATQSLIWEYFFEVEGLSINDQITTPIGGALLGEALHRIALSIMNEGTEPFWVRWICSLLVDPMGTFNRWLYSEDLDPFAGARARVFAAFSAGISLGGQIRDTVTADTRVTNGQQGQIHLLFSYAMPGDQRPFSHFNFEASATPGALPFATIFVRGILVGNSFGSAGTRAEGVAGLWGTYDFAQPALVRASSVGAGPGGQLSLRITDLSYVQLTGVISAVPYGAVGSLGLDEDLYRNYHIGPGASGVLDLRLVHGQAGMLRALVQQWIILGEYIPPTGYESVTYLTLSAWVKLGWRFAAVLDYVSTWRSSLMADHTYNQHVHGDTFVMSIAYMGSEDFGARIR
jgi:hypothetical protein